MVRATISSPIPLNGGSRSGALRKKFLQIQGDVNVAPTTEKNRFEQLEAEVRQLQSSSGRPCWSVKF
jgi:hypothetical protein